MGRGGRFQYTEGQVRGEGGAGEPRSGASTGGHDRNLNYSLTFSWGWHSCSGAAGQLQDLVSVRILLRCSQLVANGLVNYIRRDSYGKTIRAETGFFARKIPGGLSVLFPGEESKALAERAGRALGF